DARRRHRARPRRPRPHPREVQSGPGGRGTRRPPRPGPQARDHPRPPGTRGELGPRQAGGRLLSGTQAGRDGNTVRALPNQRTEARQRLLETLLAFAVWIWPGRARRGDDPIRLAPLAGQLLADRLGGAVERHRGEAAAGGVETRARRVLAAL